MAIRRVLAAALCAAVVSSAPYGLAAQERPPRDSTRRVNKPKPMDMGDMEMPSGPLGISMDRMGSGTTWIPDAVPLPARHLMANGWDVMFQGIAFGEYDTQSGPRGARQFGSLNWGMLMAGHELAGGRFLARTMLSLDVVGVTGRGYPLLLQTGESYRGDPFHDRQHPHDFFMELAALYERPLSKLVGFSLYAAPSGEPALGPVAFPMRPSAMDNPIAPLGHHWQDVTHISFGVLTAGVFTHTWKFEGSVFNGREPDDRRWDLDPIRLDSYAGRVTYNPDAHWSVTAGYGYLRSPDALHPDESLHRLTASVLHGGSLGTDGQWATTFLWGANAVAGPSGLSHSVLVESDVALDRYNTVFGRTEYVQKTAEDLVLSAPQFGFAADRSFGVASVSLGYVRELVRGRGATLGVGALGTVSFVPAALQLPYGSRTPLGAMVFVRLRVLRANADGMNHMDHMEGMNHDRR